MKQVILEITLAFGLSWLVAAAFVGCTVDQAQAYQTIRQGMK